MTVDKTPKLYKFGIAYSIVISMIAIYLNSSVNLDLSNYKLLAIAIALWISSYIPIPIFVGKAKYGITDFGFKITRALLICLPFFLFIILAKTSYDISLTALYSAMLMAFARAGEEIFYRGFVYTLFLKLLENKKKPWRGAIIISSLLFAIMHTQYDLNTMISTFLLAIFLAMLRHYTDSILIPIIIHCAFAGGILTIIMGILIYFIFILIGFLRGEKIIILGKFCGNVVVK